MDPDFENHACNQKPKTCFKPRRVILTESTELSPFSSARRIIYPANLTSLHHPSRTLNLKSLSHVLVCQTSDAGHHAQEPGSHHGHPGGTESRSPPEIKERRRLNRPMSRYSSHGYSVYERKESTLPPLLPTLAR
eukprot:772102-Rhodomonas_salina.2